VGKSGNADGAKGLCVQKEESVMNECEERLDCKVPQRVRPVRWRTGLRTAAHSVIAGRQGQCETEPETVKGNGHDEGGWRTPVASHEKPDARNPHVRFEEGADVPHGGVPLYSTLATHLISHVKPFTTAEKYNISNLTNAIQLLI